MKKIASFGFILLLMGVATFLDYSTLASDTEIEEYSAKPFGFYRSLEWTLAGSEERQAHGLLLMEVADRGLVERLVYESSSGPRLIVTRTTAPQQGLRYDHILDDATGWWIELELDFDHQWRGWRHFALTVDEVFYPASGRTISGRLTTSDGLSLEMSLEPGQGELLDAKSFREALTELEATEAITQSMPDDLALALLELTEVFPEPLSTGAANKRFAELLSGVVASPENKRSIYAKRWRQETGAIRVGLGVTEPEVLALISRFRGLSNADPLGDHRLADVVPVENR